MSVSYSGPERRGGERRQCADRRKLSRVEGKLPRRSGKGRRKGEQFGLFLKGVGR